MRENTDQESHVLDLFQMQFENMDNLNEKG